MSIRHATVALWPIAYLLVGSLPHALTDDAANSVEEGSHRYGRGNRFANQLTDARENGRHHEHHGHRVRASDDERQREREHYRDADLQRAPAWRRAPPNHGVAETLKQRLQELSATHTQRNIYPPRGRPHRRASAFRQRRLDGNARSPPYPEFANGPTSFLESGNAHQSFASRAASRSHGRHFAGFPVGLATAPVTPVSPDNMQLVGGPRPQPSQQTRQLAAAEQDEEEYDADADGGAYAMAFADNGERVNAALQQLERRLPEADTSASQALAAAQIWANQSARGILAAQPALESAASLLRGELLRGHEAVRRQVSLSNEAYMPEELQIRSNGGLIRNGFGPADYFSQGDFDRASQFRPEGRPAQGDFDQDGFQRPTQEQDGFQQPGDIGNNDELPVGDGRDGQNLPSNADEMGGPLDADGNPLQGGDVAEGIESSEMEVEGN